MNHTDIEVYIKDGEIQPILQILVDHFGVFSFDSKLGDGISLYVTENIKLIFTEKVEDDFLSVLLKNADDWKSSAEFARFLSGRIVNLIRCDPGIDFPNVNPYSEVFLEVDNGKETLIDWC